MMRYLTQRAPAVVAEHVVEWAHEEVELFRDAVKAQDFPAFHAEPLSPQWLARKASKNLDLRTMIATGNYLERIRVFETRKRDGSVSIFIGFDRDEKAIDADGQATPTTLRLVAAVHEYGSAASNIPPRPHWGPFLKRMKGRAKDVRAGIRAEIREGVAGSLKGGPT